MSCSSTLIASQCSDAGNLTLTVASVEERLSATSSNVVLSGLYIESAA